MWTLSISARMGGSGRRIIVGNDNNLPFAAGRQVNKADDTEFVVLDVPEPLSAK